MLSGAPLDNKKLQTITLFHSGLQQLQSTLPRLTRFKGSRPRFSLGATQMQIKNDSCKLESIHFVFVNPLMCR